MTQSVAVLESLRNALQEVIEWLDADDENVNARVVLQDGIVQTWIAICPPKSSKNPHGPQPTRDRMVRYPGESGFLNADECVSKVESCGVEVQEIRIHRWRKIGPNSSRMTEDEQPYFSQPPTDRQKQEAGDDAKFRDLHDALKKKIFPVWLVRRRAVASGDRPGAPWLTAQSSDALVFFVDWLICSVGDVARARFFLSASEAQIEQELDCNLDIYTELDDGESWLVGEDSSVNPRQKLEKFRARWPERLAEAAQASA